MLKDVIQARALDGYRVWIRFEDGREGVVDLQPHLKFREVFAPLKDPSYFGQLHVDANLGTIIWPNGADFDPDVLYSIITGIPILLEPAG
ncbi:MAG: DUF2442 domain-containing protein [Bryobacterales bacterium]|nr:DUF2442 domain-containing protein [Bryobacterales bacterium]MBV9400098.1 DUF2442 domain-containing protein [Bryobacterales bacterium]